MSLTADIVNWFKNNALFNVSRILLGMGILAGVSFSILNYAGIATVAIAGTAALQAMVSWRNERREGRKLLAIYRQEIAARLGLHPASVTLEHLQTLAKGNTQEGIESNSILKEALSRNSKRGILQLVTSALSGALLLGLFILGLSFFHADAGIESIGNTIKGFYQSLPGIGSFFSESVPKILGTTFVVGYGMAALNRALDFAGERFLGLHQPTSHDLILGIGHEIARHRLIAEEQVFGVFVSANPDLEAAIMQEFKRPYRDLNPRQQHLAMQEFGTGLPIKRLTYELNHYMIKPQELAFAVLEQESGVPKQRDVNFREQAEKRLTTKDILREVKRELVGEDRGHEAAPQSKETGAAPPRSKTEPAQVAPPHAEVPQAEAPHTEPLQPEVQEPATPEPKTTTPANDNQRGFASRFVPRAASAEASFAERYGGTRPAASAEMQTQVEKLKAQLEALGKPSEPNRS